ncbi:MAG: TRAP transporter fused permease subunit [Chloroflexi bacterium]|nr:TRAP transporter fused permease subunit [Chloroflexota bacterium]
MLKLLADSSSSTPPRDLGGWKKLLFVTVATVMPLFMLYQAGPSFLGNIGTGFSRGLFLIFISVMVFLKFPAFPGRQRGVPWYDWLLIGGSCFAFGYWAVKFEAITMRTGSPNDLDIAAGIIAIIISIEMTRRVLGMVLASVGIIALLYALWGDNVPIGVFSHVGFSLTSIAGYAYSMNGIFGFMLDITMFYVVLFVLFGSFLKAIGAESFFIELPYAIFGRIRGGPGITAIGASTLFGSISGSATANVAATGSFTIPLMKRAGYPPHVAGAIEPAASTGGMFMPPVMGAGAFIMADITGIPYARIMLISLAPALIYFFSVAAICFTEAGKAGIRGLSRSELPSVRLLLKRGWHFIIPIIMLFTLLLRGYSPPYAVFWCLVGIVVIAFVRRLVSDRKGSGVIQIARELGLDLRRGLQNGSEDSITVAAMTGTIGLVVGIVLLTGVGFMFTSSLMELSRGILPLALLIILFVSFVLGMGMTVTSVYVLLAVLLAPALQGMGISLLAAHMLLFWWSQSANVSPPVAIAAYVGAGIAKADPTRTAFLSFRFSAFLFVLPLLFIFSPILMPDGLTLDVVRTILAGFFATIPFAGVVSSYLIRRLYLWERLSLVICLAALLTPNFIFQMSGLILLAGTMFLQFKGLPARTKPETTVN